MKFFIEDSLDGKNWGKSVCHTHENPCESEMKARVSFRHKKVCNPELHVRLCSVLEHRVPKIKQ